MASNRLIRALAIAFAIGAGVALAQAQSGTPQPTLPKTSDKAVLDRARVLKRPAYPAEARDEGVGGTVAVRVQVSPDGEVLWARAVAGPEPLRAPAVAATRAWEFTSTDTSDEVTGYVLFRFSGANQYATIVGLKDDDVADVEPPANRPVASEQPARPSVAPAPAPTPAPQPAPAPKPTNTIRRVGDATLLAQAKRKVSPQYPLAARSARVEGTVVVEVEVDATGRVTSARAVSGHALLREAAVSAARQWTFAPTDGGSVKVIGTISFNFKL